MTSKKTRLIVYTALFAAMTTVITMLHIPIGNGYIHVGDTIIHMGATILPFPFGIFAGAIGGTLSDIFSGYAIYAIPTLIIKSINALCFYIPFKAHKKIISVRSVISVTISSFATIVGYFFAEWILYNKAAAIVYLPRCYIQPVASFVVFIMLGLAFDRIRLKDRVKL